MQTSRPGAGCRCNVLLHPDCQQLVPCTPHLQSLHKLRRLTAQVRPQLVTVPMWPIVDGCSRNSKIDAAKCGEISKLSLRLMSCEYPHPAHTPSADREHGLVEYKASEDAWAPGFMHYRFIDLLSGSSSPTTLRFGLALQCTALRPKGLDGIADQVRTKYMVLQ